MLSTGAPDSLTDIYEQFDIILTSSRASLGSPPLARRVRLRLRGRGRPSAHGAPAHFTIFFSDGSDAMESCLMDMVMQKGVRSVLHSF